MRPVGSVDYDQVPTPNLFHRHNRNRWCARSSGSAGLRGGCEGRSPARGVLHAPDCEEAPQGAPLLGLEQALNVAGRRTDLGTRLCTLCGCAQELTPLLSGFNHITDS
ncbi:DUF6233 domain-containing protein [Streptomyces olivaceus]|uniref:DUF6233 domain-containing protein n=1 Tax=Streptomyces olivaceus TaxID=47716 RepID=UPI001CCFA45F